MTTRSRCCTVAAAGALLLACEGEELPASSAGWESFAFQSSAPTPLQQGNDPYDLELAVRIRKELMAEPSLSLDAKNTVLVARRGRVTLRGRVRDDAERAAVRRVAERFVPPSQLDDRLEPEWGRRTP